MALPLRDERPDDATDGEHAGPPSRGGRMPNASSKRQQIAALVRDLNVDRQIAVSSEEIAVVLGERHPGVKFDLGGILGSLTTSGDLVVTFGRPGSCRYAHRESWTDAVPADEPILVTLRIVKEGCQRLGRDMSTNEVTDAMRAAGIRFAHPNNYGMLLKNWSQASERGALAWRAPRLARRTETDREGRARVYWRPIDSAASTERAPADAVDAAVQAIEIVEALLGYPASRSDLSLWAGAHAASHPVAQYLIEHGCLARGLEQLGEKRQARRVNARTAVHVIRTELTVPGGAPVRYATSPPTSKIAAMLEFEDRLRLFTPARELASLRALELTVRRGSEAAILRPLLGLRTVLLYDSILYPPTTVEQALPPAYLAAELKIVKERVLEWTRDLPAAARYQKAMPYRKALEEIEAVRPVQELASAVAALGEQRSEFLKDPCVIGRGATASHQDLLPYAKVAERLASDGYANPEHRRMLYYAARRIPNPDARWEKNAAGGLVPDDRAGQGWMLVDRVDALGLLWDAVHVPRTSAVLTPARALLGFILRDPWPLREVLERTPVAQGSVRRALVVALGLLGEAVDIGTAIPRPTDALDTVAFVLATVLVAPERERVNDAITAALARLQSAELHGATDDGAARNVLVQASRRVASGMWLSVVG